MEYSNIDYLKKIEQSKRNKRFNESKNYNIVKIETNQDKLNSTQYYYANKKTKKQLRAEAMSKDLRSWF